MPTTRAARRAAAARLLLELPTDVLGLVLYQLTLAHDIAAVAPTCHALCDAAKLAFKARPFSCEVVTLAGHSMTVSCVVAAPGGRIITGSFDKTVKEWRDGACERTIQAHAGGRPAPPCRQALSRVTHNKSGRESANGES